MPCPKLRRNPTSSRVVSDLDAHKELSLLKDQVVENG